ncbi:MAG TPA: pyridoxal-dependent decarboxylase [Steroidobacteraceae bacterium]|jgi:glutamate/tyrosine decarboxylase-like PLP-dependent enzyme|nr:pyridoxal-dependent decarboxylase [Steroidobacteraceae bacterium]
MSEHLLKDVAARATRYLDDVTLRDVFPSPAALRDLQGFSVELQDESIDPAKVLAELDTLGAPATVACTGGRYFGFVTGGALPAALAANMLAAAWDQNGGLEIQSPLAAHLEKVCRDWLVPLLGLPAQTEVGFVTGATMANFTGLAAARHAVLRAHGWDVEAQGLFGAPPITVVVGNEVHVSVLKGLGMLGLGRERVVRVPVDDHGRMIAAQLPAIDGPTIVCAQAGNVNTGAFDPIGEIVARLRGTGAWIHVDGAFGLWAAASPQKRALTSGIDLADSLATDAHKWLNVPYDSGLVFVRERRALNAAMSASAAYLIEGQSRDPHLFVPEMSRRARAIEVWAALRSLGRRGLAEMIERNCRHAARFASELRKAGYQVLNDVELNQVLVSFGTPEATRRVIAAIQQDRTCWCGGTSWQGNIAMRISVSSWATTDADVARSIEAILRCARAAQRA